MHSLVKLGLLSYLIMPFCASAQSLDIATNTEKTAKYFASIENNPLLLQTFLQTMPKGADLHNHFAGAFYAENLLQDASTDHQCFNETTFSVNNAPNCGTHLSNVIQKPDLYDNTINAWSMRDFVPNRHETIENHFFATFLKFFPALAQHNGQILSEIKQRAAQEHVNYLELMISSYDLNLPMGPDGDSSTALGKKIGWLNDFSKMRTAYLSHGLGSIVKSIQQHLDSMESKSNRQLHCGTPQADPACQVKARYEYYALRDLPIEEFFAQLVTAFEVANRDPRIVGINLVRPEDDYLSAHNYTLEMQMLHYLHTVYPKVHIALHAGELELHQVPPEALRFHIRQAIELGQAERIGHGTDIAYEDNAVQLLQEMASKKIPVEINLTSNADILGVSANQHPLPLYLRYHVPVTLATDDAGILRTNLTHEYAVAISDYHLPYTSIKNIIRNGITYSFLPGESLWQDPATANPIAICSQTQINDDQPEVLCQQFLKTSEKARMQWNLERELNAFEKNIVDSSEN